MIHFVTWVQSFDKGSLGLEISLTYIWLKICHQKLLKNRPTWSHWGLPKFYIQLHNSVTRLDTEEFDEFEEVEFVLSFLKGLDFMITGG